MKIYRPRVTTARERTEVVCLRFYGFYTKNLQLEKDSQNQHFLMKVSKQGDNLKAKKHCNKNYHYISLLSVNSKTLNFNFNCQNYLQCAPI